MRRSCALLLLFTAAFTIEAKKSVTIKCDKIPPALWCKNAELAELCHFKERCDAYKTATANSKLHLTVLFASRCSFSQKFIIEDLYPNVYERFRGYVEIDLVPFGNANRTENGTIVCVKGEEECRAHLIMTCAKQHMPDSLPLTRCLLVDLRNRTKLETSIEHCYSVWKIDSATQEKIRNCSRGDEGRRLQQIDADRTEDAWPDWVESVPWILINGVSLADAQPIDIGWKDVICKFYFPHEKPEICKS